MRGLGALSKRRCLRLASGKAKIPSLSPVASLGECFLFVTRPDLVLSSPLLHWDGRAELPEDVLLVLEGHTLREEKNVLLSSAVLIRIPSQNNMCSSDAHIVSNAIT